MPIKKRVVKSAGKPAARRASATCSGCAVSKFFRKMWGSFVYAISNFVKKYFQFNGTATRAEYWWMFAFIIVVSFCAMFVAIKLQVAYPVVAGLIAMLWLAFLIAFIVPWFAVQARRLHDVGVTAKLLWVSVAFIVYALFAPESVRSIRILNWLNLAWGVSMLVLYLLPSKTKNNPYRD